MTQVSANQNSSGQIVDTSDELRAYTDNLNSTVAPNTWLKIAVITTLMAALFRFNLLRLWDKTNPFYGESNWGHAIAVPLISLYYLYVNREELLHPQAKRLRSWWRSLWTIAMVELILVTNLLWVSVFAPEFMTKSLMAVAVLGAISGTLLWLGRGKDSGRPANFAYANPVNSPPTTLETLVEKIGGASAGWFGGFLMIFGIGLFGYGIYPGQNDFVKDFGMLVTLLGIVTMLAGWARMKIAWFAVLFLVCAIPWPGLVYSRVATPLQQLAAQVAVWTLEITGVESSASGTKILIAGHNGITRTLNVAEACAGLRSLMTFISVGGAVAFLSSRPLWQKLVITFSAIPIAIFCNVMRIAGQGLLDHYVSQQLSESFAHQFVGMIMLIPAFVLILLVGWVLDKIFLEEVDRNKRAVAPKIIRQQTASAAPAAVAAASGRSLASSKAAQSSARPVAVAAKKPPIVVPPPPSSRLAPRAPARPSASAPMTTAKMPLANAPVAKPAAAKPSVAKPTSQPQPIKPGKAI